MFLAQLFFLDNKKYKGNDIEITKNTFFEKKLFEHAVISKYRNHIKLKLKPEKIRLKNPCQQL